MSSKGPVKGPRRRGRTYCTIIINSSTVTTTFKHLKKCNSSRVSYFIRPITQEQSHDDDDELNINPPTPCQIGKRPPAPKPKAESAGHQGVAGGGYNSRTISYRRSVFRCQFPCLPSPARGGCQNEYSRIEKISLGLGPCTLSLFFSRLRSKLNLELSRPQRKYVPIPPPPGMCGGLF